MDHRYHKRMLAYWARMEARGRHKIDQRDFSSWFDYWHTHLDWYGRGNSRPENQTEIAAATIRLLQYAETISQNRLEPIQIWATLSSNTMDNAVYIHSPNPNASIFPHDFYGVSWDTPVPDWLKMDVPNTHEIGKTSYNDITVYNIRKRA